MSKYRIIQADPSPYREQVLALWEQYLPGTAPERFEWLEHGNPAGRAIWFLAIEEATGELIGTLSAMPKVMYAQGSPLRAAILGDFMVAKKFRVFGPGLVLPKQATSYLWEQGFELVYTIPNQASHKVMTASGLASALVLHHLVKPISVESYLGRKLPAALVAVLGPVCNVLLALVSRETYAMAGRVDVQEESSLDCSFDILWERLRDASPFVIGDRSTQFLRWRYLSNPEHCFRLVTCRSKRSAELRGYAFFVTGGGKLDVYDVIAAEKADFHSLCRKLVGIGRAEQCRSLYIRTLALAPFTTWFTSCRFVDAHDPVEVLYENRCAKSLGEWFFLSGDRNQ